MIRSKITGEPIRKATVTLFSTGGRGGGRPSTATSDASGNFIFTGIEPGRYRLGASRNGFVTQSYGGTSGASITLGRAQKQTGLEFRLVPHAVVTGRIFDEDGEPAVYVNVQLLRYVYTDRGKALRPAGSGQTNDLGEYRVFGVGPGKYFVQASPRRSLPSPAASSPDEPEETYGATYYPGTMDAAAATPVDIAVGGVAQGVDIRLGKTRTFSVSGRIAGGPADSRPGMVMLVRRSAPGAPVSVEEGAFGNRVTQWDSRTRTFTVRGVAPGSYSLIAQGAPSRSERWSAIVPVDVGGGNVSNVDVLLQPGQPVSGVVKIEGQTEAAMPSSLSVNLESSASRMFGGSATEVAEDGSFTVDRVGAGSYRLRLARVPEGHFVKSIRMGEVDVLTNGLELAGGAPAAGIEILLSPKAAAIEGTALDGKGDPAGGAVVLLIPPTGHPRRDQLIFRTTADQNGRYTIGGIPPDDYRLYAFTGAEDGEDRDPDLLARYESASEKVSLGDSAHENKSVKSVSLSN
ncbi:MAG: carboxypeptidase regulatory-like domain-containing protein [Bryobacteraceae bacterium]